MLPIKDMKVCEEKGMKRFTKLTSMTAIALAAVLSMTGRAYAAEAELSADKSSCETGEAINVDVKISTESEITSAPEINITYNPARLQFDNCSVEYGGGGGGLITISDTEASIAFTTMSGGDASVKVSAVIGDESCDGELTISVEGEDIAGDEEEESVSSTGVEAGSISAENGRIVNTVFPDEYLPKLFEKNVTTYLGQQTECARFAMGDIVLLFTTDSSESDARFMRYNEATGELSDYRMIEGIENSFIILLNEWDGDIPNGYLKSVLDWNGQTLTAFKYADSDNGTATCFAGIDPNEFFLVYAVSSEGTKGWYQYDLKDGTYQRFVQYTNASAAMTDGASNGDSLEKSDDDTFLDDYLSGTTQMIMLFVFAGLTLILLIVVIILGVKVADYDEYEYMDPEEYMRLQEQTKKKSSKNSVTAASIVKKTLDDEEDDETEVKKAKSESKKAKSKKSKDDDEDLEEIDLADEEDEDDLEEDSSDEDETESDEDDESEAADEEDSEEDDDESDEEDDDSDEDEDDEDDEDIDEYFAPRMTRREAKAYEKQLRKEEKLAAKEEKWRQKEEKRAAKMRAKGIESSSPMDWSEFGESFDNSKDSRRPMGKSSVPSYMLAEDEDEEEEIVVKSSKSKKTAEDKLPARKNRPISAQREAESAREMKEDELRKKQQRLFEQQRMIEEQRRMEQEQYEEEQRIAQQQFAMQQHQDEDLDEDFEFEFINL